MSITNMKIIDRLKLAGGLLLKGTQSSSARQLFGMMIDVWKTGRPAAWTEDPEEQVKHYKHWVYAAVSAIGEYISAIPLRLYTYKGGKPKEIEDHPFLDLMDAINPFDTQVYFYHPR